MPRLISQQGSKQQWVQQRPKTSVTKEHLQSWILLLCCRPYCKLCSWINEWPNQKPIHYEQSKTTTWFPELFLTLFGHQWVFSDAMHSNERSDQCLVMSTSIYSPGGFCTTIKHSSFDSFSFEYMWQEKKSLWPYSGKLRVLQKIYSQISCLKTEVYYKARLYS